ncbi:MAG: cyclic nucleotide-binding domain-containing protein [Hyphomicrobiales bacterium]
MRDEDLPAVRAIPLFARMEEEHFQPLMRAAYFQQFPEAVHLIREGDRADFLHVLFDGAVELFAAGNGRESLVDVVRPYQTFILAAVVRDAVHLMSARTVSVSKVLMIPSQNIREAFEADAAFARSVVLELGGRYRGMVKALKNQKLRTSVERLANYLLQELEAQGGTDKLVLPMEKRALASLLGMTPENLSRAFGTLGPYGVSVEGPAVRLTKLRDLRVLAKPNPLIDDPEN